MHFHAMQWKDFHCITFSHNAIIFHYVNVSYFFLPKSPIGGYLESLSPSLPFSLFCFYKCAMLNILIEKKIFAHIFYGS